LNQKGNDVKKDDILSLSSINGGDILPYRLRTNIHKGRQYTGNECHSGIVGTMYYMFFGL